MGRPLDIVDLFLVAHLVADELLTQLLGLPDAHGPVVRASHKDCAVLRVPEGVAADLVDRTRVAIVRLIVVV